MPMQRRVKMHKMTNERRKQEAVQAASMPLTTGAAQPGPSHSDLDLGSMASEAATNIKESVMGAAGKVKVSASKAFEGTKRVAGNVVESAKQEVKEVKKEAKQSYRDVKASASETSSVDHEHMYADDPDLRAPLEVEQEHTHRNKQAPRH